MSKKATGIKNAHYATFNIAQNCFDTPKPILDLETLAISETYAEGSNYADNLRNIYIKELTGADISLEFSNISREIEAALTGQAYENGELQYSTSATAPQVALLFEKTYSDGSTDRIVYYNCKLSKDSENADTKTDAINFTGDSVSGQAIPMSKSILDKQSGASVSLTGVLKFVMDSKGVTDSSDSPTEKRWNEFFQKVQFKGHEIS